MKYFTVLSSSYDTLARLVIKAWNGKSYTVTAEEIGPYGMDSRPVKDVPIVYASTQKDGDEVMVGCLNKNRKAEEGEVRLFCTDADGNFKFNLWLRADGTGLIGDSEVPSDYANFATLYNETKTELDKLKASHNELAEKWNSFCNNYVPGSPSTTGTPANLTSSTVEENDSDFTKIKHSKLKYNESNS